MALPRWTAAASASPLGVGSLPAVQAGEALRRLPVLGTSAQFLTDRLAFMAACARQGDIVRFRIGPRRAAVVSHPELVRQLYLHEAHHLVRGVTSLPVHAVLGDGLLLSDGEEWRRQRHYVQPLFTPPRTDAWSGAAAAAAADLIGRWSGRELVDAHQEMRRLSLDIAARAVLGATPQAGHLHASLEGVLEGDLFRGRTQIPPWSWFLHRDRRLLALERLVSEAAGGAPCGMAAEVRAHARSGRELRDQLITLLFTTADTTAVALTWALELLARHEPDQQRVREETLDRGYAAVGPYTTAVIKETLRLYPSTPVLGREVSADVVISGVTLPRGTLIFFSPWAIQRDARWFEQPEAFLPARWLGGLEQALHPFAFFPFGGGRRNCVGRPLAMVIIATALPLLIGHFRFTAEGPMPGARARVTLLPTGGRPLSLQPLEAPRSGTSTRPAFAPQAS
jgi:cytochrome P450